jgi:hypothetical protein
MFSRSKPPNKSAVATDVKTKETQMKIATLEPTIFIEFFKGKDSGELFVEI